MVAIAGPPNAGKSTLLNRLAQREAAIVSPHAGTTRDVIEVHLDLGGFPVTLLDTAGIRETSDPVEMEGVSRARARAAAADLVLWLTDAMDNEGEPDAAIGVSGDRKVPVWRVTTKIDLLAPAAAALLRNKKTHPSGRGQNLPGELVTARGTGLAAKVPSARRSLRNELQLTPTTIAGTAVGSISYKNEEEITSIFEHEFILSAQTGVGFDGLLTALFQFSQGQLAGAEQALVTRQRHRQVLAAVQHILSDALSRFGGGKGEGQEELLAEELRQAAVELGRLMGRVDVEDVQDVIFRDFCIGK